jgi:hypothetical protein
MTPTLKIKRTQIEGHYQRYLDAWEKQEASVIWESTP